MSPSSLAPPNAIMGSHQEIQLFNLDMMKLTSETIATTLQAEANHCQYNKMSETAMLAAKKASGSKGTSQMKGMGKGLKLDNECCYCHWISKSLKHKAAEKKTGVGTASLTINSRWNLGSESSSSGYAEFIFMAGSITDRGKLLVCYLHRTLWSHPVLPMTLFPLVMPGKWYCHLQDIVIK